jgi:predicted esterase
MKNEANTEFEQSADSTLVVLIHGLAAHWILLWPLGWRLRRSGFKSRTFGYRSWFWSIETHAAKFEQFLSEQENDPKIKNIHIVAHSMGAIVTRQALLNQPLEKLRRVVMLGAPNQGSPTARLLGNVFPFCKTLRQISNQPGSFVCNLPEPTGVEIGIVAAKYDRVIPEPNSHLQTESDHVVIFSGHNGLLVRPTAARRVSQFLKTGRFHSPDYNPQETKRQVAVETDNAAANMLNREEYQIHNS